jgi:hypothetical protein
MDQIHLSPLVDQIQLTLGHISNSILQKEFNALFACLSATSQQYFSLTTNQPPATSNQPAVLFSQNKPAPVISHQPTEQAAIL